MLFSSFKSMTRINDVIEQLIDTWHINNRIHLYLLEAILPDALSSAPTGMKGRSVREIFAHIHNVRLMWLTANPTLNTTGQKIPAKTKEEKAQITHEILTAALTASASDIARLLEEGLARGKIRDFKPHPSAFLGYLISHEGYHRGEICMTLTEAGHPLSDKILYGLWEWGVR